MFCRELGLIYPKLTRVREVSTQIAARVIRTAQKEVRAPFKRAESVNNTTLQHVDRNEGLRKMSDEHLLEYVKSKSWNPTVKGT
jgi:malate dehydrogenase (oxaloacetate-decarboxylating)(NADP+)